jgi:glutathione S-transferase
MRELGRELAGLKAREVRAYIPAYEAKLMRALKTLATVRKHTNILQHMFGYLRDGVDDADRQELARIIEDYHQQLVPLKGFRSRCLGQRVCVADADAGHLVWSLLRLILSSNSLSTSVGMILGPSSAPPSVTPKVTRPAAVRCWRTSLSHRLYASFPPCPGPI